MSINRVYIAGKLAIRLDGTRYIKLDAEMLQNYFATVMGYDSEVDIEINVTRVDLKRSRPQLNYFYSTLLPIVKQGLESIQGEVYNKDEVISFLKDKFFYEEVIVDNKFQKLPLSLSNASKEEASKFISDVITFSEDILQLTVPQPTKEYKKKYGTSTKV